MNTIAINKNLAEKVPGLCLSCIECDVQYEQKNNKLWTIIQDKISHIKNNLKLEEITIKPVAKIRHDTAFLPKRCCEELLTAAKFTR